MGHDHHHHASPTDRLNRAFAAGVALNVLFVAVEFGFGFVSGSIALVADAGHNLGDVLGLLLAWGAAYLSRIGPNSRRTYGLRRSSILAALVNAVILLVATGGIAWESIHRLGDPAPVATGTVMIVAAIGVVLNGATALLFLSGSRADINVRGAFLHMLADAAVSLGVVVGGFMIRQTGWTWSDPASILVIVAVILASAIGLLRDALHLALDAVPPGIDPAAVESYLATLPGITAVHDLHIWGMSTTETALTAHLVKPDGQLDDDLLNRVTDELFHRFGIIHATIQLEQSPAEHHCALHRPANP